MSSKTLAAVALSVFLTGAAGLAHADPTETPSLALDAETRLAHVRQLTFGGENAEAYFSPNGTQLVFQSTRDPFECDQIFRMDLNGENVTRVSTGKGRTTCAYFHPDGKSILYSSTHLGDEACPPRPDYSQGYVWPIYPEFDVFLSRGNPCFSLPGRRGTTRRPR